MDSKETSLFTIHVLIVSYCVCLFGEFAKILKGKSDADKQLICIVEGVHFQVRVGVFNLVNKARQRFLSLSFVLRCCNNATVLENSCHS